LLKGHLELRKIFMIFNIFKRKTKIKSLESVMQDSLFSGLDETELSKNKLSSSIGRSGLYILGTLTISMMVFFIGQATKLQIFEYENYLKKSDKNQFVEIPILPIRGSILDRNGEVLAKSEKIKEDESSYHRVYIEKEGLGHVLGYVKYPQKDKSGNYFQDNFEGVSGIEAYYDQLLAGKTGKRVFEKDVAQNLQNSFITDLPIEGKDIKLSIDSKLQSYAYKELRNFVIEKNFKGGSVVIMDIETGEILVLTNYPEYSSYKMVPKVNEDGTLDTKDRNDYLDMLSKDKDNPMLNRAIAGTFAPGSTLKTVFALAGLQLGLIDPVTSIFSSGRIEIPNAVDPTKKSIFRDWKAHGWVNVRTALANSSDVFFYAIGGGYETQKGMGIGKIKEYSEGFGVNSPTGIDLGSERFGNIPDPEWKKKIFKEDWRLGDTYTSSIGQFGFLVTPIYLVKLSAALAKNGKLITPKLRIDGNPPQVKDVKIAIKDEWYKVVQEGMRMVITSGTAKSLNSNLVEIAGKSGTAEVGVKKDKIQSWITGYFPYKKPRYAFVFLCELGIRDKSPTPNVLARKVIEKMYFMDEYNQNMGGKGVDDVSILEEIASSTDLTPTSAEVLSR
jgi:penicillin-binding protein 2